MNEDIFRKARELRGLPDPKDMPRIVNGVVIKLPPMPELDPSVPAIEDMTPEQRDELTRRKREPSVPVEILQAINQQMGQGLPEITEVMDSKSEIMQRIMPISPEVQSVPNLEPCPTHEDVGAIIGRLADFKGVDAHRIVGFIQL